jgi:hypothetical protein
LTSTLPTSTATASDTTSTSQKDIGTCEQGQGHQDNEVTTGDICNSRAAATRSSTADPNQTSSKQPTTVSSPEALALGDSSSSSSGARAILQSSPSSTAASAPVQGRVTVREWQPADNDTAAADPKVIDPDITVQGEQLGAPGSCPIGAPCLPWLVTETGDEGGAGRRKRSPLVISNTLKWVLVGVGSGLGLLLLLLCCFAAILWRRRREKEEKERRKERKAAAAAATAAGGGAAAGPMQYGKKAPRSKWKGQAAAAGGDNRSAAAGGGGGGFDNWDPTASLGASSPVLPVSGSGGTEMAMESLSGEVVNPYPAGPRPYAQQQQQQQPRRSGLLGFFGRGDPALGKGGLQRGIYEELEVPVRPPTLPGHFRDSGAGGVHHPHHQQLQQPARTRISLQTAGSGAEDGPSGGGFAAALGFRGGRTQQMRQVPRSQGMTSTEDSDHEGGPATAVAASATARAARAGRRKASQQSQQQGGEAGKAAGGDAVARVGRRPPVRAPAQRDNSENGSESPPAAPGSSRMARGLGMVWQSLSGGTSMDGAEGPSKQA